MKTIVMSSLNLIHSLKGLSLNIIILCKPWLTIEPLVLKVNLFSSEAFPLIILTLRVDSSSVPLLPFLFSSPICLSLSFYILDIIIILLPNHFLVIFLRILICFASIFITFIFLDSFYFHIIVLLFVILEFSTLFQLNDISYLIIYFTSIISHLLLF